jgi:hypothetical protein
VRQIRYEAASKERKWKAVVDGSQFVGRKLDRREMREMRKMRERVMKRDSRGRSDLHQRQRQLIFHPFLPVALIVMLE